MNRSPEVCRVALVLAAAAACSFVAGGCKKAPPPPPPAPPPAAVKAAPPEPPLPKIDCPGQETFLPFLVDPGPADPVVALPGKDGKPKKAAAPKKVAGKNPARTLRTDCVVFAPGRFWLAAVLSYDEKTGKNARLGMVSGGPDSRPMLFDVLPLPTEAIEKLLKESPETGVRIRKTRSDNALVRLGVTGSKGGGRPDSAEVGFLLQLVAHKPPQILWVGVGDTVTSDKDGCVFEQLVDFELLFRTRLERFNVTKIRPDASGKTPPNCKADGPSTQDSVNVSPLPLPRGRVFGEVSPPADPKAKPPAPAAPPAAH